MKRIARRLVATLLIALFAFPLQAADGITIATAANFKPAMEALVKSFQTAHADARVDAVFASSGKLSTQIREGAPFDLFFSADLEFAQGLADAGLAATPVKPYARGRIVLWSGTVDARPLKLAELTRADFAKIAIANPRTAPYGTRAEEALRAAKLWDTVQPRLVFGESIAQAAQFVQSGNAQIGIVALSQALDPDLAKLGGYALIPDDLHQPLDQAFIVTRRAADNALAAAFAKFIDTPEAQRIITAHGYTVPGSVAE